MASLYRVLGLRVALGAALLASACQHDSNADFDDRGLTSPDVGGSDVGGSSAAAAGENPGAAGGAEADAGGPGTAGKSSGGAGGSSAAGKGGSANVGGKAGANAGGTGQAGKAGQGGGAGSANGGTGGTTTPPEPVTIETSDIDDTNVAACFPNMNFGEERSLNVDGDSCAYETLIDWPRLDLPTGAQVSNATLSLTCTNAGGVITVAYANEAWKELMVRWNTRPEVGETLGTVTCVQPGELTIDLTSAFDAWLSDEHARDGIYLRTESTDGTDFASSEADKAASRPKLNVTYTLPK
jgi:hypothetical protein